MVSLKLTYFYLKSFLRDYFLFFIAANFQLSIVEPISEKKVTFLTLIHSCGLV